MKTKEEKAEELADKLMAIAKDMNIRFTHGYEDMKKQLVIILLKEREEEE